MVSDCLACVLTLCLPDPKVRKALLKFTMAWCSFNQNVHDYSMALRKCTLFVFWCSCFFTALPSFVLLRSLVPSSLNRWDEEETDRAQPVAQIPKEEEQHGVRKLVTLIGCTIF